LLRHGAPTKDQPRKIARVVAQHYFRLTGRKPTVPKKDGKACGPFLDLLSAVFRTLDLGGKVSALSQAEMVARDWPNILASFSSAKHGIK
jgi:hypothetical protein